ncbi:hypothetical protein NPIL_26141 [Nephila pilipes]|uniref:Uncharacterized protein n=1 Tax=Nephila pilipes TaxID=299642 RepID=A0A8X6PZM7_NEPPI|nr:hypothetical protein NPIL_26141 [Nephila pilipes]
MIHMSQVGWLSGGSVRFACPEGLGSVPAPGPSHFSRNFQIFICHFCLAWPQMNEMSLSGQPLSEDRKMGHFSHTCLRWGVLVSSVVSLFALCRRPWVDPAPPKAFLRTLNLYLHFTGFTAERRWKW